MVIAYGTSENWRWNGSREVIEFTVLDEARPILCHLSREFIEDNFGNPSSPEECLDAAKDGSQIGPRHVVARSESHSCRRLRTQDRVAAGGSMPGVLSAA